MSIKTCKDCGTEVSSDAKACPKCGRDQRNFFLKHKILTFFLVVILVAVITTYNGGTNNSIETSNKVEVIVTDFSSMSKTDIEAWCDTNKVSYTIKEEYSDTVSKGAFLSQSANANSTIYQGDKITIVYSLGKEPSAEYKNALKKAESYSEIMNMSKQAIYDQLTSEYGEQFPADAAQYAIDNIEADWKANALAKAKSYSENLHMSKSAIYDQLISKYGEKFTKEEAQYAIDHLYD